jgi:hypothetical protein
VTIPANDIFFIVRHAEQTLTIIRVQKIPPSHSNIPGDGANGPRARKTDGDNSPKAPGHGLLDGKYSPAPIAVEAVRRIDELFAIERMINGKTAAESMALRQEQSKPLVEALETWLREQHARLSAKSDMAKAITYGLSR